MLQGHAKCSGRLLARRADAFKKMQRQAPHSKDHKLGVIVPFREGCSAMSQVHSLSGAVLLLDAIERIPYGQWRASQLWRSVCGFAQVSKDKLLREHTDQTHARIYMHALLWGR